MYQKNAFCKLVHMFGNFMIKFFSQYSFQKKEGKISTWCSIDLVHRLGAHRLGAYQVGAYQVGASAKKHIFFA